MNKLLLLSLFCIVCALPVGAHAANPSTEYPAAGENGHPCPGDRQMPPSGQPYGSTCPK